MSFAPATELMSEILRTLDREQQTTLRLQSADCGGDGVIAIG
jgi:hypothetical protein